MQGGALPPPPGSAQLEPEPMQLTMQSVELVGTAGTKTEKCVVFAATCVASTTSVGSPTYFVVPTGAV
jgi:hypothetical protein